MIDQLLLCFIPRLWCKGEYFAAPPSSSVNYAVAIFIQCKKMTTLPRYHEAISESQVCQFRGRLNLGPSGTKMVAVKIDKTLAVYGYIARKTHRLQIFLKQNP